MRRRTRNQFLEEKMRDAKVYPVSLVAVNFQCDNNLGFLTRAAACFGAAEVIVIGSMNYNKKLRQLSANTSLRMRYTQVGNPGEFLSLVRERGGEIVSIELSKDSHSIYDFKFNRDAHTYIVVGNETTGVPAEICFASDTVHIPMPGFGKCLNTSQAGHVALYEYSKQIG